LDQVQILAWLATACSVRRTAILPKGVSDDIPYPHIFVDLSMFSYTVTMLLVVMLNSVGVGRVQPVTIILYCPVSVDTHF